MWAAIGMLHRIGREGAGWSGLGPWSAGSKNKTFLNIRLWLQPSDQWRGVSCVCVCVSVLINAHNCTYTNTCTYTYVYVYKQLANCPTAGVADGLTSSPASLELKRIPSRTAQANYVQVYVHLCCIWVCVPPSLLPILIIIGPALLDPARNGSHMRVFVFAHSSGVAAASAAAAAATSRHIPCPCLAFSVSTCPTSLSAAHPSGTRSRLPLNWA